MRIFLFHLEIAVLTFRQDGGRSISHDKTGKFLYITARLQLIFSFLYLRFLFKSIKTLTKHQTVLPMTQKICTFIHMSIYRETSRSTSKFVLPTRSNITYENKNQTSSAAKKNLYFNRFSIIFSSGFLALYKLV